jgi:hypothetical protein
MYGEHTVFQYFGRKLTKYTVYIRFERFIRHKGSRSIKYAKSSMQSALGAL